jgi:hypothetical protein
MGLLKRATKGDTLTQTELDENFTLLGDTTPKSVAIVSDQITVNGADWYQVDTEGGASTDNLTKIVGTRQGDCVRLRLANASHSVTILHGAFLKLQNGMSFTFNTIYDSIVLISYGSDVLVEDRRANVEL